jgi:hypothetical protein
MFMRINLFVTLLLSLLVSGCFDSNKKDCYEASRAVAETTEKYLMTKDVAVNGFWNVAMNNAVLWRSEACKNAN